MQKLGRYEILGELGRGAMGVVYEARDPVIDRVVAIKTIDPKLSGDALATFREGFFREARSAGRLNHPCIVTIYDAGEADNVAFIAMEVLGGPTLREALDERPLAVSRTVDIAMQVAYGLSFAHAHGVIHRDVKPANIALIGKRRVKIADFGIAEMATAASTVVREVAGSPKYMSPEQIKGGLIDGRSDVFSLGAVVYEMLTGRPPFRGESVNAIMHAVLETDPPRPSSINRRVPADLDAIVMRMLAKQPDDRYASARALYGDLRRWQKAHGEDPEAQTAKRRDKAVAAPKPAVGDDTVIVALEELAPERRMPAWRRAAIGVGAVTLLVSAMGAWWIAGRESAEQARESTAAEARMAVVAAPPPTSVTSAPPVREPAAEAPVAPAPPEPVPPKLAPKVVRTAPKAAPPQLVTAPAPVTAPEPPREIAPPAPPPPPAGTLQLAVAPWGEVFVNGKSRGMTPPMTALELPPGRHRVEIIYHNMPAYRTEVKVDAGETQRIAHRFE